jgi:hypothetical protein
MESIHEYVIEQLQATKGTWPAVAKGSRVPLRSLEKIARREIENPGVQTVEKLARYFQGHSASEITVPSRAAQSTNRRT